MIRRRRRIRNAEPQYQAASQPQVVLARLRSQAWSAEIRHQIVKLREPPGDILGKHHVNAATRCQRKRVLALVASDAGTSVHPAEQKFHEWNEMIEAAQIQTRT